MLRISQERLDLSKPRWDQSNFSGRAKHFFTTVNPLNVFATDAQLQSAKELVKAYNTGAEPAGTTDEEVWAAKHLCESAFHPETGEKVFLPGRMSFQVWGNMTITGFMMTYYRTLPAIVFWQWVNQSFNAIVNYSNRNASAGMTNQQIAQAYAGATGASVATALAFNRAIAASPTLSSGLVGRLVPLFAVAGGNMANIPLMRQRELVEGIDVMGADGEVLGKSKAAAQSALAQVVPSRVLMGVPSMAGVPFLMQRFEKTALLRARPVLRAPVTVLLTGMFLTFSTPLCCAIFPQTATLPLSSAEPHIVDAAKKRGIQDAVYFNKGL